MAQMSYNPYMMNKEQDMALKQAQAQHRKAIANFKWSIA